MILRSVEHLQARQFLALEELEGGAATGGDVREAILREAEVAHCGSGIATTDDGECAGSSGIDESLGHGLGALDRKSVV